MSIPAATAGPWEAVGFFHLRTPALPFEVFVDFCRGGEHEDVPEARRRLRAWLGRGGVREALYLSSPALDEAVDRWVSAPPDDARVDAALYKYLARMAGRPTPFGLMAATRTGVLGPGGPLELAGDEVRRRVTLGGGPAARLAEALAAARGPDAPVSANPTLVPVARRLHYAAMAGRGGRGGRVAALEPDEPLGAALAAAGSGATLGRVVAAASAVAPKAATAEVERYVRTLLERGILVLDAPVPVTGADWDARLLARLATEPGADDLRAPLESLVRIMGMLEAAPPADHARLYREGARILAGIGQEEAELPFHVELVGVGPEPVVPVQAAWGLHRATLVLQRLFRTRRNAALEAFKDRFVARFGSGPVPLLLALDEEMGVGFGTGDGPHGDPSPLLDGVVFPAIPPAAVPLSPGLAWLLPRVSEALRTGTGEVRIREDDLDRWEAEQRLASPSPLPDAFTVLAAVARADEEAGGLRFLHLGAGSQGPALLGRFGVGDPRLRAHLERFVALEEALRPDAVFAEVVLHPQEELAHVSRRPVLRQWEIPAGGRPGTPPGRWIPLSDLQVEIMGSRVRLTSVSLGREVLPRFSCALRPGPAEPGVVRFLLALQVQEGIGVKFSWGPLDSLAVLPRVVTGDVVLSLARWRLERDDLAALRAATGGERREAARALRTRLGIPRLVGLRTDEDGSLPLDLEHPLALEVLVRREGSAELVELFPAPGEEGARSREGGFRAEVVVPFVRVPVSAPSERVQAEASSPARTPSRRSAVGARARGGGAWCYARLYTGPGVADRLLIEEAAPLARQAVADGLSDRWFFIRYADPDPHLRLRVRGRGSRPNRDLLSVIRRATDRWMEEGLIWKVRFASYEREVQRFGGLEAMDCSEALFHADSEAVVSLMQGAGPAEERGLGALVGMHHLLLDFGLDLDERIAHLAETGRRFAAEFRVGRRFRQTLGEKIRAWRPLLEGRLAAPPPSWARERSNAAEPALAELRRLERAGRLEVSWDELVRAHVHLHVNRAVRASPREHEFVLITLLRRLLEGERGRSAERSRGEPG